MTEPALVGRGNELQTLVGALDEVQRHGTAIAVVGDPGIGKSALLDAAVSSGAQCGFLVLMTTGIEAENHLPYAGLRELLRPLGEAVDDLPSPQQRALLTAFGIKDGPPPEPFLISLAALNLLGSAATRQPVLLSLDDLQWFDAPSHEALAFLARRIVHDRIVCVGSLRTGHPSAYVTAANTVLEVGGLDDTAARRLLARHAEDLARDARERIFAQAGGNPLALVELPAAWRAAGASSADLSGSVPLSDRLERAFAARLEELTKPARDALLVAAVATDEDIAQILAGASILAGEPVGLDSLDEAAEVGLVRFQEPNLRFRHPLVRSGILQTESMRRRHAAHAAMAHILRDEPYRRAWHRAQAIIGPDDEVADDLELHHRISIARGAVPEAIAALERAAQLSTDSGVRGRRLLMAAEYAFGLGRADIVDRLLSAAERNSLSELDRARVEWLREIFNDGVPGDAARVNELAGIAGQAATGGDVDLALNLLLGAALRCWWADTGRAARATVVSVTKRLPRSSDDPRYVATLAVAEPVACSREVAEILGRIVVETVADADALRLYGMAAHAIGDPVRAVDCFDRAEARLREQGRLGLLSHVLTMGMYDRIELGDWHRARSAADETQRIARESGQPIWDTGTLSINAMLSGLQGDPSAHDLANRAEHEANGRRLNDLLSCVQIARGYAYSSAGRYADAYSALRRIFDPADSSYHLTEWFHAVMYFAEAAAHIDQREEARDVLAALSDVIEQSASRTLEMQLLYAHAVLAEDDDAEARFTTALAADLMRWPLLKARLELAYGSWLRRQRRVAESREPLRSAQATLGHIGAKWWAEQARAELRAAGERADAEVQPTVLELLSPQELQIARLAADGMSNREIAQRLFLSPRTVGSHLYRIFPKLGITSRAQIAQRLNPVP